MTRRGKWIAWIFGAGVALLLLLAATALQHNLTIVSRNMSALRHAKL